MKVSRLLKKGELAKGGEKALKDRYNRVKLMRDVGRVLELALAEIELAEFLAAL